MKPGFALAVALVASSVLPALAQDAGHRHPAPSAAAAARADPGAAMTQGVVKRVDKTTGRLTIAHDAIKNLGMPKMTMVFRVKDDTWLDRFREGDRIRFAAENPGGVLTVVAIDRR